MTLVAAGSHSREIAELLLVSPETVRTLVSHAMRKLGAHTQAHAVAIALLTGQIRPEP
jgi:DNA-binding CsgD family transcriptional regulator